MEGASQPTNNETPLLDEYAGATCRVCFLGNDAERGPLLAPCLCDGSIRYIHQVCLNEWRISRTSNVGKCELCKSTFLYELEKASCARASREMAWQIVSPVIFYIMTFGIAACIVAWRRAGPAHALQVVTIFFGDVSCVWACVDLVRSARSHRYGLVGKFMWQLNCILRLPYAQVKSQAAMLAQFEATRLTESLAHSSHRFQLLISEEEEIAVATQGVQPLLSAVTDTGEIGMGAIAMPAASEEFGDEVDNRWTCYSLQCCVELVCFGLAPPILSVAFWACTHLLNQDLLLHTMVYLAIFGGAYFTLVCVLFVMVVVAWPHLAACCDSDGFPIVRNLRSEERSRSNTWLLEA